MKETKNSRKSLRCVRTTNWHRSRYYGESDSTTGHTGSRDGAGSGYSLANGQQPKHLRILPSSRALQKQPPPADSRFPFPRRPAFRTHHLARSRVVSRGRNRNRIASDPPRMYLHRANPDAGGRSTEPHRDRLAILRHLVVIFPRHLPALPAV